MNEFSLLIWNEKTVIICRSLETQIINEGDGNYYYINFNFSNRFHVINEDLIDWQPLFDSNLLLLLS